MVGNVLEGIATKLSIKLGVWLAVMMMGAIASSGVALKIAVDGNSAVMSVLVNDINSVKKMAVEMRGILFKDKLRLLQKQTDKMKGDIDDIKILDIVAASDFCASPLFVDYISNASGSDRISINRNCGKVNDFMREN